MWELNLLEILNQTVSFVLLGARYKLPLWELSVLVGAGFFVLNMILAQRVPRIIFFRFFSGKFNFIGSVITAPIVEEIIFRLILITFLADATGSVMLALFVSALLFGIAHLGHGSAFVLTSFLGGLVLGWMFINFGIAAPIIAHMTHNLIVEMVPGGG